MDKTLEAKLRERLKGKVLIVGIGNSMRSDDSSGPKIIEMLDGKVKAELFDAGEIPESHTGRILAAQADTILLIDAADFGAAPGDLAILEPEDCAGCSVSTHRMPLGLFSRYIKENSHADMFALGIQAAEIGLGEPMSPAVAHSVQHLAEFLEEVLRD
jgi:hydrogenase 3 maturation protease